MIVNFIQFIRNNFITPTAFKRIKTLINAIRNNRKPNIINFLEMIYMILKESVYSLETNVKKI